MAFSPAFQAILTDQGVLALGCYKASIGGSSIGDIDSASFEISAETRKLACGYPKKVKELFLDSLAATASVTCLELGATTTLLNSIATSLASGSVPTTDLALTVFKPVGKDITISFNDIYLLQQLELSFSNDYNRVKFSFEQGKGTEDNISDNITVTEAASVITSAPCELISSDNISIGFPNISTLTSVQSVSLRVNTEYKRLKTGYPAELLSLTPLSHSVELEVASEEFTSAAILAPFTTGSKSDIIVKVGTYDGNGLTFTLKAAMLEQSLATSIAQKDFSTLTKRFIATGDVLLTVS